MTSYFFREDGTDTSGEAAASQVFTSSAGGPFARDPAVRSMGVGRSEHWLVILWNDEL